MVKNMLDVCLGGIAFWFFGYGFIFGPNANEEVNKFSGEGYWTVDVDVNNEASIYTQMFFHLSFLMGEIIRIFLCDFTFITNL